MKKKFIFGLMFCFLGGSAINAQQADHGWSLGLHGGVSNYSGDLTDKFYTPSAHILNYTDDTDNISLGISVSKYFNKTWGLRLMASKEQFTANDRAVNWKNELVTDGENFNRSLNVKTELENIGLSAVMNLGKGKSFFSPYLVFGLGAGRFKNYADLYKADGGKYYYWSDNTVRDLPEGTPNASVIEQDGNFETELSSLKTEGVDYKKEYFYGTLGLGLKFRLFSRMSLNIESLYRFTNTDYLDDVSGDFPASYDSELQAYAANPANINSVERGSDNGNDRLHLTTVSLHYYFGKRREEFIPPVILIGDITEEIDEEVSHPLPTSKDSVYQPIPLIPVATIGDYMIPVDTSSSLIGKINTDIVQVELDTVVETAPIMVADTLTETTIVDTVSNSVVDTMMVSSVDSLSSEIVQIDSVATTPLDTTILVNDTISTVALDTLSSSVTMDSVLTTTVKLDTIVENKPVVTKTVDIDTIVGNTPFPVDSVLTKTVSVDTVVNNIARVEQPVVTKTIEEDTALVNPVTPVDTVAILNTAPQPVIEMEEELLFVQSDDLYKRMIGISSEVAELKEEDGEVQKYSQAYVDSKLFALQAELDSIKQEQAQMSGNINRDWNADIKAAIEETQKQIDITKDPRYIQSQNQINSDRIEMEGMRREMKAMERYVQRLNVEDVEIDDNEARLETYRRQLALYDIRMQNMATENKVENERLMRQLSSMIDDKTNSSRAFDTHTQNTGTVFLPAPNSSNSELAALQSEVTNLTKALADMRNMMQLQNNNAILEKEVAVLKAKLARNNANPTNANTVVRTDNQLINQLNSEIADLRRQVQALSNQPQTHIPNTVTRTSGSEAIRGREIQMVFFKTGVSNLSQESMTVIQNVGQLMNQYSEITAELEGYTDASGSEQANLVLSGKRAIAVQNFIAQLGVDRSRLITIPKGEDTSGNPQFGRRVVIRLLVR